MSIKLKKEFLELLDKDIEFRYAIAGYLGFSEILKRLDNIEGEQRKIWENIGKLWEEVKYLRENQEKLWKETRALREGQNKLWEEVKGIKEDIKMLFEGQNKLWEEVRNLREGQDKLWEGQNKLWEEVRNLREGQDKLWEGQNKLWEEVKLLREGQNKLWEEVKYLRENQEKLWKETRGLKIGLNALSRAVGRTLEDYTIAYLSLILEERGYKKEKINLRKEIIIHDKERIEMNIFNEDPLVIGEVKTYVGSIDEARNDIEKLIKKIKIIEKIYDKKAELSVFSIANVPQNVLNFLREITEKYGIIFIYGKELKEELLI